MTYGRSQNKLLLIHFKTNSEILAIIKYIESLKLHQVYGNYGLLKNLSAEIVSS